MIKMEEDWDAEVSSGVTASGTFQNGTGNMPKLRGFGRGKPINFGSSSTMTNSSTMNGAGSNGFGRQSSGGTRMPQDRLDDDWGDSRPAGGSTKSSGGNGEYSDDWNETSPPASRFGGRSGGGSRGGGFVDRAGGRGCHKCGEEGHFARDCPSGGGGGSRGGDMGGRGCHKCGEEGHFARDCPSGGGGSSRGGGGRGCHKCGEEGHFARDCPSGGGGGGGGGGRGRNCHKCGEEGHFARDCPSADGDGGFGGSRREGRDNGGGGGGFGRKQGGFSKGSRGGFGNPGAAGDDGEKEGSRGGRFLRGRNGDGGDGAGSGAGGCRKCGEEGHFAREYPNGGGGGGRGGGCHKCGENGHFARECPKAAADGEKPREIYVPTAVDEDTLFSEGIHQGINFDKYDNIQVLVTGSNKVEPISTFEDANLLPSFIKNIQRAGYIKPTPIQKYAIPSVMAGRDLMGCAQTGSGKTAAFILPVLTAMLNDGLTCSPLSPFKEPQTVVVAPTRELACQIYNEARKFSLQSEVRPVVVYGGVSVAHQLRQVEAGCNLVVGTPGRLLDFVERGKISLSKVKFLILDEADRMLDMGFEPSIRKLVDSLGMPPKSQRQTLMFSATFKAEIQKLAADFMNDYLFITVGIVGGACTDVEQTFLEVDRMKKRDYLCDILNTSGTNRVLVFVGQKRNADFLASYLSQSGYPTTTIHGDRLQREREEALRDFKKGKSPVLIATNVAARGLDIPDVTHVVNYDLPSDIDEYVHRIGRTGRCGNLGKATSFYSNDTDQALASSLVRILSEARQEIPDWLADYAASGGAGAGGHFSGRFASKDIRHKKFDNGSSFATGDGGVGRDADYGGSYGGAGDCGADDEVWD